MTKENPFDGAHETKPWTGERVKFAIGDVVRLKDGSGAKRMTVQLQGRHPDESLDTINCSYRKKDLSLSSSFKVDDLELVPPEEDPGE